MGLFFEPLSHSLKGELVLSQFLHMKEIRSYLVPIIQVQVNLSYWNNLVVLQRCFFKWCFMNGALMCILRLVCFLFPRIHTHAPFTDPPLPDDRGTAAH